MEIIGTCFCVTNFGYIFGIRKVELFKCHDPKWLSDKIPSEVEKKTSLGNFDDIKPQPTDFPLNLRFCLKKNWHGIPLVVSAC